MKENLCSPILDKFRYFIEPKSNCVFSRYKFQCIVQSETDMCDRFITKLKFK